MPSEPAPETYRGLLSVEIETGHEFVAAVILTMSGEEWSTGLKMTSKPELRPSFTAMAYMVRKFADALELQGIAAGEDPILGDEGDD